MSVYVTAATRRSSTKCPWCKKVLSSKHQVYGLLTKYFFCCRDCDLGFAYGYKDSCNDDSRVLIIQAVCPLCHEDHKIEVVGKPDTDHIPCEGCWYTARDRALAAAEEPSTNDHIKLPNIIEY